MRVVLTTPPYDKRKLRVGESLGLGYLAGFLKKEKIDVTVLEPTLFDWDVEKTCEVIRNSKCDVLGISIQFNMGLQQAVEIMKIVKQDRPVHISCGGHFATFNYMDLLSNIGEIDSIVMFEGEQTFLELIKRIETSNNWKNVHGIAFRDENGDVAVTPPRPLLENLDKLPFPNRVFTFCSSTNKSVYSVISTRGCLFNCTFCSVSAFYSESKEKKWRTRSTRNVMNELEYLVKTKNAREISFLDDNFIGSCKRGKKRAIEIANEINKKGINIRWSIECRPNDIEESLFKILVKSGLKHVNLGIESGTQSVLNRLNKELTVEENKRAILILRSLGISASYYYIMFDPYTTIEELEDSIKFVKDYEIGNFSIVSNRLIPYKGTRIYKLLENENRLIKNGFDYSYQFIDKRVEIIYLLIVKCLYPLEDVEKVLDKISYQLDNSTQNVSDYYIQLDKYLKVLSSITTNLGFSIIEWVKEHNNVLDKDLIQTKIQKSLVKSIRIRNSLARRILTSFRDLGAYDECV